MTKIIQDISLGHNLHMLRKRAGLSQVDVCARLDLIGRPMSRSTYSQIETGTRNIFLSDLIALHTILNFSYDELFTGLIPVNKYKDTSK